MPLLRRPAFLPPQSLEGAWLKPPVVDFFPKHKLNEPRLLDMVDGFEVTSDGTMMNSKLKGLWEQVDADQSGSNGRIATGPKPGGHQSTYSFKTDTQKAELKRKTVRASKSSRSRKS